MMIDIIMQITAEVTGTFPMSIEAKTGEMHVCHTLID
jgi:hypothetical protein